jgi:hypothetical protein
MAQLPRHHHQCKHKYCFVGRKKKILLSKKHSQRKFPLTQQEKEEEEKKKGPCDVVSNGE